MASYFTLLSLFIFPAFFPASQITAYILEEKFTHARNEAFSPTLRDSRRGHMRRRTHINFIQNPVQKNGQNVPQISYSLHLDHLLVAMYRHSMKESVKTHPARHTIKPMRIEIPSIMMLNIIFTSFHLPRITSPNFKKAKLRMIAGTSINRAHTKKSITTCNRLLSIFFITRFI